MPLTKCIRQGDLRSFDLALQRGEDEFVKRRIYLTLERGRDIALRNLLRKVFIAGGFEESKADGATPIRRTRVPVDEFRVAITMGSGTKLIDTDEVECLLANMIFKVSLPEPPFLHDSVILLFVVPRLATAYVRRPSGAHRTSLPRAPGSRHHTNQTSQNRLRHIA